jgi:ABC-type hemin transport system substrate-binding protein
MAQSFRFVPGHYVVTGLNNLFLAREHILQWKPTLVIADLHGFRQDIHHFQQLSSAECQ